jgi:bacteriocin biosynthesis cyclodehydratase domain-containing protein
MRHAYFHGPFGTAVCELLTGDGWRTGPWTGRLPDLPAPHEHPIGLLVASWRDLLGLDAVDAAAHRLGYGWFPVVYDHPYVRIGPLVRPGAGPCLRCYHRRTHQHAGDDDTVFRATRDAYAADPELGPVGQLSSHVAVAAALSRLMLSGLWAAGTVARWHVVGQELTVDQVIGVHACDRCGLRRSSADRSLGVAVGSVV